jgi:hypothetical protein
LEQKKCQIKFPEGFLSISRLVFFAPLKQAQALNDLKIIQRKIKRREILP